MNKIVGEISIGRLSYKAAVRIKRGIFRDVVRGVGMLQQYKLVVRHFPFKRMSDKALFVGWVMAHRRDFKLALLKMLEAEELS